MPRALWLLIIATTINITGASFLWPLNAIIMTQELGRTLTASGFVLMLNAGAGVIGSLLGGRLFDKLGSYKTIVLGASISTGSAMLLANFYEFFSGLYAFFNGDGLGLWDDGSRNVCTGWECLAQWWKKGVQRDLCCSKCWCVHRNSVNWCRYCCKTD